jgi:hypothetical protein
LGRLAAEDLEGGAGGFAFGVFFALAAAAGEFAAFVMDGAFKDAVVVRTAGGNHLVTRGLGGVRLEIFLKFALGIVEDGNVPEAGEGFAEMVQDKIPGGSKTAIKENSAEDGFKGIGERGGPFAAAVGFLAAADDKIFAQAEQAAFFGEGAAVDELGAGLGERAFVEGGKFLVQLLGEHELEDGIAEEFKALVVLGGRAEFMGDGRMGERELEQGGILKGMAEAGLEGG